MYKFFDLLFIKIINVHDSECFTLYTGWHATNV